MISQDAEQITRKYREIIKSNWATKLKKQGYSQIEEDEAANDFDYRPNSFGYMEKTIGAVAFWKVPGKDGVVIKKTESYEVSADGSKKGDILTGTEIALVGNALPYFKKKAGGYLGPIPKQQIDQNIRINDTAYKGTILPYAVTDFTLDDVLNQV